MDRTPTRRAHMTGHFFSLDSDSDQEGKAKQAKEQEQKMRRWETEEPSRTRAPLRVWPLVAAFAVGAVVGLGATVAVNLLLVEMSIGHYLWGAFFGALFLAVAGLIFYSLYKAAHPQGVVLGAFGAVLALAGVAAFSLQHLSAAPPPYKVPLYGLVGSATSFVLLFALVDLLNASSVLWGGRGGEHRPLIQGEAQVYLVAGTSAVMGLLCGLLFGLMGVEDAQPAKMRELLAQEEHLCYPVGALLVGAAAAVNQRLRETTAEYEFLDPMYDDELDVEY